MKSQEGSISIILAFAFGLLFICASIFGIWAFSGRQDYKNNVDSKIEKAVELAVQETETAKDAEFVEKEKSPTQTFTGPSTYGSVSFSYPKTWSVYTEESSSGTVVNLYAHPQIVPGTRSKQPYALRLEITSDSYDKEVSGLQRTIDRGELTAQAFRPQKLQNVLGLRVDGTLESGAQGAGVYLPLRDRTIKLYTEIPQHIGDFTNIILPSLTYVP